MREIKVYAPAKINLYLDVLDRRKDGFHNIETLFEKIDLKDELVIREKGKGISVETDTLSCPSGKDNIVYKAAMAICQESGVTLNLDIRIKKNIPLSAGLGGGSSDAAATLRAINEIFGLNIAKGRLFSIAGSIGKDVPFFMIDDSFAVGKGAGELLEPIDIDYALAHILIKPDISVSTTDMYKRIDAYKRPPKKKRIEQTINALRENDIFSLEKNYYNIFEEVPADHSACIKKIKILLSDIGVKYSLLSGSGPSVFCTLVDREEARSKLKEIPEHRGMNIFLVHTHKGGIYGDNRGQDISKRGIE